MNRYEKLLEDAEKELEKYVKREAWIEANQRQGFRDGVLTYGIDRHSKVEDAVARGNRLAEKLKNESIEREDYGKAAYWTAWIRGRYDAETSMRLDEFEAMGLK